jgi:surface protein
LSRVYKNNTTIAARDSTSRVALTSLFVPGFVGIPFFHYSCFFLLYEYTTPKQQNKKMEQGLNTGGAVVVVVLVPVVAWDLLPEELIPILLSYFDVKTLIKMKQVSRSWRQICTNVIYAKRTPRTSKVFETRLELRDAVERYCNGCSPNTAEDIAQTYGWPIGRWDVSNLQDLSWIFRSQRMFNEDISAWDVSNATTMQSMFGMAIRFNQDLSLWDTSQVTIMSRMFYCAYAFNGKIGAWDTSKVTTMAYMFNGAWAFNQPIGSWDISRVTTMNSMFNNAVSFNQDMSSWGRRLSATTNTAGMFHRATAFNEALGRISYNYYRNRPIVFSTAKSKSLHGTHPAS